MTFTPEQLAIFAKLSPTTRAFMVRVARRITEGYEGEIILSVKAGRDGAGVKRGSINLIRWSQVDDGDAVRDEVM